MACSDERDPKSESKSNRPRDGIERQVTAADRGGPRIVVRPTSPRGKDPYKDLMRMLTTEDVKAMGLKPKETRDSPEESRDSTEN